MDFEKRVIAFLAGAVLLVFGLWLEGLAMYAIERQVEFHRQIDLKLVYFLCALALPGYFCIAVGYRLAFNRPNRYQSILGPFGWYSLALVFAIIGACAGFVAYRKLGFDAWLLVALAFFGLFAALCVRAGRIAARRGIAKPLLPGERPGENQ